MFLRIKQFLKGEKPFEYILYKVLTRIQLKSWFDRIYKKRFYKRKNRLDNDVVLEEIETYDGYNQSTHPDITFFQGKTLLVLTPYPYSNEIYENPCIYYLKDGKFIQAFKNPVESPETLGFRHHFSDPAFLNLSNKIFLFFRDSLYESETRKDVIYRLESFDGLVWNNKTIIDYTGNSCIAPSFVEIGDKIAVYYVTDRGTETNLFLAKYDNNSFTKGIMVAIANQPIGYTIWHVDVKKHNDIFVGLFTYIDLKKHKGTRLFLALSADGIEWTIVCQIDFGKKSNVKNLYKATSHIDSEGKIVSYISGLDSHMRWFIYKMDITEKVFNNSNYIKTIRTEKKCEKF